MNNGFGWKRLLKSFLVENTVYLLMTALIRRIKAFVFKYVSVAAKWIKTSRMHMLNIYTGNRAYENVFKAGAD